MNKPSEVKAVLLAVVISNEIDWLHFVFKAREDEAQS